MAVAGVVPLNAVEFSGCRVWVVGAGCVVGGLPVVVWWTIFR